MVDRLINAIAEHKKSGGKGDPFDGFDREQLRRAAKARGITLGRGEGRDSIAAKLLADLGQSNKAATGAKGPTAGKRIPRVPRKAAAPKAAAFKEIEVNRGELEKAQAQRQLSVLQARLKIAGHDQQATLQGRIRDLQSKIDQKPGGFYNWDSPWWNDVRAVRIEGEIPAERTASHVDQVVSPDLYAPLRGDVVATLNHQASVAPRSMLNFKGVGALRDYNLTGQSAWAYYQTDRRMVFLSPDTFGKSVRSAAEPHWRAALASGWWSHTDSTDPLSSVLAHEFGHHVAFRALAGSHEDLKRLTAALDEGLGLDGWLNAEFARTVDLPGMLNRLMPPGPGWTPGPNSPPYLKATSVSTYGMRDHHELMAEIWHEYTTAKNPRPHIAAMGDAMRLAAESWDIIEL